MRLVELFQKPAEVEWVEMQHDYAEANFKIRRKQYMVYLERIDNDYLEELLGVKADTDNMWLVEFSISGGIPQPDGQAKYGITGTGDAFEVFASVTLALKEFAQSHKNSLYVFSAAEPSRISLYKRLTAKMGRNVQTITKHNGTYFLVRA